MKQASFYKELGEKIRHYRSQLCELSQADFADRVQLSRPSIVNIEKGRQQISAYQLIVFSEVLGVEVDKLLAQNFSDTQSSNIDSLNDSNLVPEHLHEWVQNAQ